MPDIFIDVDSAVVVPVNLFPLTDDTDFKTRETAVAYNAAGMDLVWNFVTSAGVQTQTAVTPTTSGSYDWTHVGDGMYSIEIPASGGASINNNTEGYGWFSGVATGVLPWRGPVIGFRAAALNDALCDGGDYLDTNVVQWLGSAAEAPISLSDINAEVVDVIATDARTEPTTVPAANAPLSDKINFIFMLSRNKIVEDSASETQTLYADDGTTPIAVATVEDAGTTTTRGEMTDAP